MCFIIDENHREVLIADKDIVCYKYTYNSCVKKNGFYSIIMDFPYEFNKLYKRNALRNTSYKTVLRKGFHSCIEKPYMLQGTIKKTIKCIIPKGSRYLMNLKTGEYISNMIMPIKVIPNKYY